MDRLPRVPFIVFDHSDARGHQSLARDQLEYVDLATNHQRRSYALLRDQHELNIARDERPNSALSDGFKQLPTYAIGGWVWVYNTASTIRQGAKVGTDAKVLKVNLLLNWTGPFKILVFDSSLAEVITPDGRPLAAKLLYLDLPNDVLGVDALCRVSVVRFNLASTPTTASTSRDSCPQG